jgi:hypothetical protein
MQIVQFGVSVTRNGSVCNTVDLMAVEPYGLAAADGVTIG